jgi:hypothetical protein
MWRLAGEPGARDVVLHNVDAVGEHQTTNLGVGSSNLSGRAISSFRFNTRALSHCDCAHSVPISVPISPFRSDAERDTRRNHACLRANGHIADI